MIKMAAAVSSALLSALLQTLPQRYAARPFPPPQQMLKYAITVLLMVSRVFYLPEVLPG